MDCVACTRVCICELACVRARARARAKVRAPHMGDHVPVVAAAVDGLEQAEGLLHRPRQVSCSRPRRFSCLFMVLRRRKVFWRRGGGCGGGCQPRHLYAARASRRGRLGTATASDVMISHSRFQPRRPISAGHQCSHRRRRHPRHEHGSDTGESASASACARTRTRARASPPASPPDAFAAPGLSRRGAGQRGPSARPGQSCEYSQCDAVR